MLVIASIGVLQVWARSDHAEKGDDLVTFSLEELDEHLQVSNLPALSIALPMPPETNLTLPPLP